MKNDPTPTRRESEPPEISPPQPQKIPTPSTEVVCGDAEDAHEIVNAYGTYEIQRTADTNHDFPTIAQGSWLGREELLHPSQHNEKTHT